MTLRSHGTGCHGVRDRARSSSRTIALRDVFGDRVQTRLVAVDEGQVAPSISQCSRKAGPDAARCAGHYGGPSVEPVWLEPHGDSFHVSRYLAGRLAVEGRDSQ